MPGPVSIVTSTPPVAASHDIANPSNHCPMDDDQSPAHTPSANVHNRKPATSPFASINPSKLLQAGIDPNDKTSLHLRVSLWKNHPIKLNLMPKGDWSIDGLINMLSHRSMGLGINCPNLPLSIINTGEDGIKVDAHNMVMSFLERKEQDASFLCCARNETWDNAKSKPLLIEMSVLSKQLSTLFKSNELASSWRDILDAESAVVGVNQDDQSTTASLILKFANQNVCLFVALFLLSWSCIADVFPTELQQIQHVLRISKDHIKEDNWVASGSRARDRKQASRKSIIPNIASIKSSLASIDKLDSLKGIEIFTNVPSTALSLSFSLIQFAKKRWMSLMINGIPWSKLHYSCDNLKSNPEFQQWLGNHVQSSHLLIAYETRPEPRAALWLPVAQAPRVLDWPR